MKMFTKIISTYSLSFAIQNNGFNKNLVRTFSTSLLYTPTISFKYNHRKRYLENKLREILEPYYNMENSIIEVNIVLNIDYDSLIEDGFTIDEELKSLYPSFDSYLNELVESLYHEIDDEIALDSSGVDIEECIDNDKARINVHISVNDKYVFPMDNTLISNKIPSGKRNYSTVRENNALVEDIISFEYEDHGDYLDRKLKEILLPYYNMDNSISEVTITFETFDGNLTLHLHSGILSKSTASSLDTYLYGTAECMHSDIAD
jgi:hypothetical protein